VTLKDVVVVALLAIGVGLQLLAALGLIAMRDTLARIHYLGPAGFGLLSIALAILVEESFSMVGDKALLSAAVVLLGGPVLAHVTARAVRVRRRGGWEIGDDEDVERVRG
jgi:multisubunit Na+/H+ antiporter MnhG subunit